LRTPKRIREKNGIDFSHTGTKFLPEETTLGSLGKRTVGIEAQPWDGKGAIARNELKGNEYQVGKRDRTGRGEKPRSSVWGG